MKEIVKECAREWLKGFLMSIAYVWSLPNGLVGLLLLLIAKLRGRVHSVEGYRGAIVVNLIGPFAEKQLKRGWYGHTIGWCEFMYHQEDSRLIVNDPQHIIHEHRHVVQQWVLGIFQPLFYLFFLVSVYAVKRNWKEAYKKNPFEVDARRVAGE